PAQELFEPEFCPIVLPVQKPAGFEPLMSHSRRRPALFVPKLLPADGIWVTRKPVGFAIPVLPKKRVQLLALFLVLPIVRVAVQAAPTLTALEVRTSRAAGMPVQFPIVELTSTTSSMPIEIDVNDPLVVPNVNVARSEVVGQYSSIASVMPCWSTCRIAAEQLTVQERNGHVPARTAPSGLIVPVPWSTNVQP